MKRIDVATIVIAMFGIAPAASATQPAAKFSNCTALQKVYPGGIAKSRPRLRQSRQALDVISRCQADWASQTGCSSLSPVNSVKPPAGMKMTREPSMVSSIAPQPMATWWRARAMGNAELVDQPSSLRPDPMH